MVVKNADAFKHLFFLSKLHRSNVWDEIMSLLLVGFIYLQTDLSLRNSLQFKLLPIGLSSNE